MLGELTGAVTLYYEISTMLKTKPGTTTQTDIATDNGSETGQKA
jgi:hypothetical protein